MQLHDVAAARAAAGGNSSSLNGAWQSLLSAAWSSLGQDNPGGGVQDLAEALKVAMQKGLSSGQDLAPALAKALDDGLHKAAQTLTSQGVSASKAAHLVARFRRELSKALDALDPPGTGASQGTSGSSSGSDGSAASASTVGPAVPSTPSVSASSPSTSNASGFASASSANTSGAVFEAGALQLVTAQGDRVTIRFREGAAFATGAAGAASEATTAPSALLAEGRVQISVRGNLNADELKAINDLLSQVDSLASQFFSGDLQGAFSAAAALNADPGEIARYSLHLTYAQLGVGPVASTPATSTVPAAPVAPAAPAASSDAGSTSSDASAASSGDADGTSGDGSNTSGSASPSTGTDSSSAPTSSASPQQTIGSFIQDVLGKLAAATGGGSFNFSMKWKLELLASALPSYAPSAQSASAPSTQLASATLKSLAS
jgi:hypothetical protein